MRLAVSSGRRMPGSKRQARYAFRRSYSWEGSDVVVPGDEIAAGVGDAGRLVASQSDREQVLDALKAAFVQGRLSKDEFDLRVGKVLATYAELEALTADLPARPRAAPPPRAAGKSHNKRLIQRGTAAGAGASVALAAVVAVTARGNPVLSVSEDVNRAVSVPAAQSLIHAASDGRPQQDSNLRSRLRRPLLSPLSYGGWTPEKGTSESRCADTRRHGGANTGRKTLPSRE